MKKQNSRYKTIIVDGSSILEHRYVMEQYLGRKLKKEEIIHHINNNSKDNRIENLMITNRRDHLAIHSKTVGFKKTIYPQPEMGKSLLNQKEVGDLLSLSQVTVQRYEKKGLPVIRLGESKRYNYDEVLKWFKENYK